MEVSTRVIQNSSVVHGLHWGRFMDGTFTLLVVKAKVIEAFQVNEEEKSLYCVLEQNLDFDIGHSAMHFGETSDELILTSTGKLKIMMFSDDFFKNLHVFDLENQNANHLEVRGDLIGVSIRLGEIFIFQYSSKELVKVLNDLDRIIDWTFNDQSILLLQYNKISQEIHWDVILVQSEKNKITPFEAMFFPVKIVAFLTKVFVFGDDASVFITSVSCLEEGRHEKLSGCYSSHCIFENCLHLLMDDGSLYKFQEVFIQVSTSVQPDCLMAALESLIYITGHHGKSSFINSDYLIFPDSFRSGAIIDSLLMPLHSEISYNSLITASCTQNSSQINSLSRVISAYPIAQIGKIAKYATAAIYHNEILFLLPNLTAIHTSSYKILQIDSLGLSPDHTLSLSPIDSSYIQITEWQILDSRNTYKFPYKALCGSTSFPCSCIGLINQSVLFFNSFSLIYTKNDVDFSTIWVCEKVFIGMQTGNVCICSHSGEELEMIMETGVPHSYL